MKTYRNPWAWIPTLYFAEALPYVAVMTISVVMYKRLGISNADIALYTSWLYLPWVIKPFWSPVVDLMRTKRWWVVAMELIVGASLAGVAFSIPAPHALQWTLAFFWLMAFSSATHDIAADGFYMLALTPHEQSMYVGIRSTFYRIATIAGQGLLIMLAGHLEHLTGDIPRAWTLTFALLAALFFLFFAYHVLRLPRPSADRTASTSRGLHGILRGFGTTFVTFFSKERAWAAILFMLLYRLPEAQLAKMANLFLIDPVEAGGLGLDTESVGFVQGTVGIIGLTLGGIVGGVAAARHGLRRWLWPMVWAISLPDVVYVYLSYAQPSSLWVVSSCVFVEQLGYGFGFTAYMLYLIYYSRGASQTAHYAICTAFMALGMMLPGMAAGVLQEWMGYRAFFLWVTACCLATFGAAALLRIDPSFGKKG